MAHQINHHYQLFHLRPGDSLFFDADAQHGPEVLVKLPARYLSRASPGAAISQFAGQGDMGR